MGYVDGMTDGEDDAAWTPNCPACLVQMELEERGTTAVWVCPNCGLAKL